MPKKSSPLVPGRLRVQADEGDDGVLLGILEGVPLGGHGPAGARGVGGVGELSIDFEGDFELVVVVAENGVGFAGEVGDGVHLLELGLPARGVDAIEQGAVPVVSQHEQSAGHDFAVIDEVLHAGGDGDLLAEVFVGAPVAEHEHVCCGRVGRRRVRAGLGED